MKETSLIIKTPSGAKKSKGEPGSRIKFKKILASSSNLNACTSIESSFAKLLTSEVTQSINTDIKHSFHLRGDRYLIFHGPHGAIQNIYISEYKDGKGLIRILACLHQNLVKF